MSITLDHESARQSASAPRAFSPARARRRVSTRRLVRLLSILPPVILGLLLLGGWYLSTARGLVPTYELSSPADTWSAFWNGMSSGLFPQMTWTTLQESLGGFLLALFITLPLGYSLAKWRLVAATVHPYLAAGMAIPAIVWIPFLNLWMGYGMGPIVLLCFLVVLFPMVVTIALGFTTIEPTMHEAACVEGAGFWPMLARVEFPLALPAIMAAIRTGLTLSIIGALVGEFVSNSDHGLGALIQIAKNEYDVALMLATVLVLAVLAALFYGLAWALTRLSEVVYG